MDEQTSTNTTAVMAENLTALAELLGQHPELPAPYVTSSYSGRVEANFYLHIDTADRAQQREMAAGIVRSLGGEWSKQPAEHDDTSFDFHQTTDWGRIHIRVHREAVCERVVVGTETVTIPATEAAVIEAEPGRTEVREVVEWRCSSLLAPAERAVAEAVGS